MALRKHSFPPVVDPDIRVLVLGSLPGDRSLAEQRYYAHPQNQFWKLMSAVLDRDLVSLTYEARLAALLGAHIGLWDVVASATRPGSMDAALRDVEEQDLCGLVATLPKLRAIAFNGATAFRVGVRQLGPVADTYAVLPLPSSSALHTIGVDAKLVLWRDIKKHTSPCT
ncbi:DNA-deoxyinosine glycosylase [Sphingomonas sp. CJ20]